MKRIGFWLGIVGVGLCLSCSESNETKTTSSKKMPKIFLAQVTDISDGDTLWIKSIVGHQEKIKIRMLRIDTPESKQRGGLLAKEALMKKAPIGASLWVQSFGYGKYGRMLALIYPEKKKNQEEGASINYEMVADGFAWADRHYSPKKDFLSAEKAARKKGIGIWAEEKKSRVIPPWFFRRGMTEKRLRSILSVGFKSYYHIEPESSAMIERWLYILVRGQNELEVHFAPFRTELPSSVLNSEALSEKLKIKPWMILGEGLWKPGAKKISLYQDWFSPYSDGDLILTAIVMQRWIKKNRHLIGKNAEMDLSKTEWPISYSASFFQARD